MPIFVNGKLNNIISDKPEANIYLTAKPTQEFFDQFFNSKSVYPIKLKGDLNITSKLNGTIERLNSVTDIKFDEDSSLYYMGATIGDSVNPVHININALSGKDWIKFNNLKYDKIIASQNNKKYPNTQITANGSITLLPNNNVKFNNFRIKTSNPTDAKIFNILFKKPMIKQGVFISDLVINGDTLNPKILGTLDVTSIDVPVVDAAVKDIHLIFKPDIINIKALSTVMENQIVLNADMQNKLTAPYIFNDIKLDFDSLDLNVVSDAVQKYETTLYKQNLFSNSDSKGIEPEQINIKNGTVQAKKVKIKELVAKKFIVHFVLDKDKIVNIKDYSLRLANGTVKGNATYNLNNSKLNINTKIKNFNAQTLSEALFNMKSQFSGTLVGNMNLNCTGTTDAECLKTLAGKGKFEILDGRMPKLGSLEYLLKATNVVTSGITRISINNIIDLITPLKTGEFKSINGRYNIESGIVKDIEIFSHGEDLNLYLSGTYNIESSDAKMEVYGTLSNNLTSVIGKLKNLSLNTLLNTIPLLNNTEYSPEVAAKIEKIPKDETSSVSRIFAAIIDGDINGYSYVKSFKWVK